MISKEIYQKLLNYSKTINDKNRKGVGNYILVSQRGKEILDEQLKIIERVEKINKIFNKINDT